MEDAEGHGSRNPRPARRFARNVVPKAIPPVKPPDNDTSVVALEHQNDEENVSISTSLKFLS